MLPQEWWDSHLKLRENRKVVLGLILGNPYGHGVKRLKKLSWSELPSYIQMALRVALYRHWTGVGYVERRNWQLANGVVHSSDDVGYSSRIRGLGGISISDAARTARQRAQRKRKPKASHDRGGSSGGS